MKTFVQKVFMSNFLASISRQIKFPKELHNKLNIKPYTDPLNGYQIVTWTMILITVTITNIVYIPNLTREPD